ncbi:phosphoenolpyruvate--protein phosphotransferase [Telmatospirillum siberiense]|uniref:Phosphoenolpyruvate--protein phosphotransferase n=1 Tax=Telmatospirillum siberiense TaxID=382514 RepID=A0A2N3PU03_9PROT|nr:phosphoenolpyruvate--protein phosphotransferase [Telmatospirillum siberiense]PKU23878.1 phosphoenolpyruvate--protein phosphotransferase [Telmatospirillum siberiense]
MIGIVLVSHSRKLALAIQEMVLQMVGPDFPIAVAAGVGDEHEELGTDAVHISEVLLPFCQGDGAVVLMDLGSAVLSAQTALELLDPDLVPDPALKLRLCPAPIVEASVAAAVAASVGGDLDTVADEARVALAPKEAQLEEAGVSASPPPAAEPVRSAGDTREVDVVVDNPHGLHARPAATLVQLVNRFQSDVQLINRSANRGPSSARSLTSVALLQIRKGDEIRFSISGEDARSAADAIRALADDRFGESGEGPTPRPQMPVRAGKEEGGGIPISEGIAIGRPLALNAVLPDFGDDVAGTPEREKEKLDEALRQVAGDLRRPDLPNGVATEILAAQALVLGDPVLLAAVGSRLAAGQCSAAAAWRAETEALAASYAALEDDYLRARAADLRDIAARVLRVLAGGGKALRIQPDPPAILLAGELLPSEAMACDPSRVLGVVANAGSPSAHAAIIIRSLGIPMVVDGSVDFAAFAPDVLLAIDGGSGEVWVDPDPVRLAAIEARRQEILAMRAAVDSVKTAPAVTSDGQSIEILANVGSADDAARARDNGAEGVGLLRTEFLYLGLKDMPDEEKQAQSLAAILANLGAGPVVIRTPDIGADKPLAFMPTAFEHNPFLGVRGLRLSLRHPDFFASNLRAILRAGVERDVWIMFPMVTAPDEMRQARAFAEAAHRDLEKAGVDHRWPVKLGMMVEVPAAAMMIERFAGLADFLSIGTNDLTQYLLAAERGNGDLDALQDAAHPAVLRAIHEICGKAGEAGCHVSVCGDGASDPLVSALMIGAGVRSLSVRPNQLALIKAQVRAVSIEALRALTRDAMRCDSAAEAREIAKKELGSLSSPG